jgi:Ca-activated chloride channel family protein
MSFAAPFLLLTVLILAPILAGYVWLERRRGERSAAWARPSLLPNMVTSPQAWRRHLPVALLLIGMALLLVGFARPQAHLTAKRHDATLILVLDTSGSMAAADSVPTRLGAAKRAAAQLIAALPHGYRVAVVSFSDHAAVIAPPAEDVTRARTVIQAAKAGPRGTALTDGVLRGIQAARAVPRESSGKWPPATVVVLSDGGQTAGNVTPQQVVRLARNYGVPVTSVSIGTPNGVVNQKLTGGFTERIEVPVEPQSLQRLSQETGGRFFAGARSLDVAGIYRHLGTRVGHRPKTVEVTAVAAGGGLAFMLTGAILSGFWFRRLV